MKELGFYAHSVFQSQVYRSGRAGELELREDLQPILLEAAEHEDYLIEVV